MPEPITRRTALKTAVAGAVAIPTLAPAPAEARLTKAGWVVGHMSGARALVQTLIAEGTLCVFGIPGAQENELWDEMKSQKLPYLLVTHEFSASYMADGYARSTGRPGVLCVVPGPGLTNSLSGIGEALLDSIPMVCIVGDVARGDKYRPFQVHELPQVGLLQQVTKGVFAVEKVGDIPCAVRRAFQLACAGEPGPVGVVVPYNLLMEAHKFASPPLEPLALPFDEGAFHCAVQLLSNRRLRVGIYAGLGCMAFGPSLARAAEVLQAPVATSVSGKGSLDECHPLAVGWGYGPQGTCTAEKAFEKVDAVLAIGVRYSEVSTAFYNIPKHKHVIHVDANPNNLGRVVKANVCLHADAGVFLSQLLAVEDQIARQPNPKLVEQIKDWKCADAKAHRKNYARCGVDPMQFVLALRRATSPDTLVFVDVTATEHWAAEGFCVRQSRTYFNPTDNQSMGWSVPAAIGAQAIHRDRPVVAVTGDGCFLMSMVETSTAAREGLPVKFFVLDDHTYHYMQILQKSAYRRTTATILAGLDYEALARGFGLAYLCIGGPQDLEGGIQAALSHPGPVLVRVKTDYGKRPMRWIEATKSRFIDELSAEQKVRFLARLSGRALQPHPDND
jgi:acetolactate synthase-1/2/3 large subunit